MKHLGNFVALLILAVNALFTGLLLFTAYSPHIQPVTHPVQSCLGLTFPVFLMINAGFLIFWLVIQRYRSALLPLIGMDGIDKLDRNGTQNQICCLVGNEIAEDVQLSEIHKKVWLLFFRVLQVSAFSG